MKTQKNMMKKSLVLLLAVILVFGNIATGTIVYAAEDPSQGETAYGDALLFGDGTDALGGEDDVTVFDTQHNDVSEEGGDSTGTGGMENGETVSGDKETPGDNGDDSEDDGMDIGNVFPREEDGNADGPEVPDDDTPSGSEDVTDEEETVLVEEEELETVIMEAMNGNVSGEVRTSNLAENEKLVLTGDTTLFVDEDIRLKSVSGQYTLIIRGTKTLDIDSDGHGIDVREFWLEMSSDGSVNIESLKDGLHVQNHILIHEGVLKIRSLGNKNSAIYSPGGNFIMEGGYVSVEAKKGVASNALHLKSGNVEVKGGKLFAHGADKGIYAQNGAIKRYGGYGEVSADAFYAIWAKQNVEITGGKTKAYGSMPICAQGMVVIQNNADVYARDDGDINAGIGINGVNGIVIDHGGVRAESKAKSGIALYSLNGDIKITTGNSVVTAWGTESGICAENGTISLDGEIDARGQKNGILAKNTITIEGGDIIAEGGDAIYSNRGTVLVKEPLAIVMPEGGKVSGKTIVGPDGKTATDVRIQIRPLSGSVSIANGDKAEVGDVLTLKFSNDFPFKGRSFRWQKKIGYGSWKDIPGATTASYTVKEEDQGHQLLVKVTVAGYDGEKTSKVCTVRVKPALGGSVTYSNSGYNSNGYAYLNDAVTLSAANLTPANIPNDRKRYQWQISDDGTTGWTDIPGATNATYKPPTDQHGKFIRVVFSAYGYTGSVEGSALNVRKSQAVAAKVPELEIAADQVRVNHAQPNQEYLVFSSKQSSIPEAAWAGAKSPKTVSALYLGGAKDSVNFVYTRVKETDKSYVGAAVSSSIYLGSTEYLQDFYLDVTFMRGGKEYTPEQDEMGRYNIRQGDVLKIDAVPVPADATNYWGISSQNWLIDNLQTGTSPYGGFFQSGTGTTDLIQSGTSYKTVYYKPNQLKNGLTLSASLSDSGIGYKHDEIKVNVGTTDGKYVTDNLYTASSLSIRKGKKQGGFWFSTTPEEATTGDITVTKTSGSGTEPVITFNPSSRTFEVNAENADAGTYAYSVSCANIGPKYTPANLTVNVLSDECTVRLDPNNGKPTETISKKVTIGSVFVLPGLPDTFTKPEGDFGGWLVDGTVMQPGKSFIVEDDITISVKWVPHVHRLQYVPGFEPTCTWPGNAEYWHCEVCGKLFADEAATQERTSASDFEIPATGHTPGPVVREKEVPADEDNDGSYDEVTYCTVCHVELSRMPVVVGRRILENVSITATTRDGAFGPYLENGSVIVNWKDGLPVDPLRFSVSDTNQPYQDELFSEAANWTGDTCFAKYTITNTTADDRSLIFSKLEASSCTLTVSGYNTECTSVTPYIAAGESRVDLVFRLKKKQEYAVKATPEAVVMGAEVDWNGNAVMLPAAQDIMLHNEGMNTVNFDSLDISTDPEAPNANAILTGPDADVFKIIIAGSDPYPRMIPSGGQNPVCAVQVKTGTKFEPNRVYTAQLKLKTKEAAESVVSVTFQTTAPERTGIWMEEIAAQEYTSKKITPEVKVYWGETLLTNADYTVSYKNNVNAYTLTEGQEGYNAAKAPTITIKGKGNYKGTFTRAFVINQANLTTQAAAENVKLKYTGKNLKPTTTVTAQLNGVSVKLTAGKDFAYEYPGSGCNTPGPYTIKIIPKSENFKGYQEFNAQIIDGIPMSKVTVAKIKDVKWENGLPKKAALTLKYGKETLAQGIDYTVSYENNRDVGTATVTIKGTENTAPGCKTYFGTVKKTFKITGTSIAGAKFETDPALWHKSFDYDGTAKKQVPASYRLTLNKGTVVIPAYGYTVSYEKNTNPGTAKIIFTGRPELGYTGKLVKTFTIAGYDVSKGLVTVWYNGGTETFWSTDSGAEPSFRYNLGGVKPEPVVKFGTETLVKGKDYTVSWSNNSAVKTDLSDGKKIPTVTIKGKGSFKGTITRTFKIEQKPFDNANVTVIASDVQWQDKAGIYKPAITVLENSTGKVLKVGRDYGAWNDTTSPITFVYKKLPASGEKVMNDNGKNHPRTPETVIEGVTPVMPTHIIPAGTEIEITVKGKGAYSNTPATATYKFVKKEVSITGSAFKITIPEQQWTGKPIELKEGDITVTQKVSKTEKTLKLGTDYEIVPGSYLNNINRGTAKVTIRGKGTYGGTKQVSFRIVQRRMNYEIRYDKNETGLLSLIWDKLGAQRQNELRKQWRDELKEKLTEANGGTPPSSTELDAKFTTVYQEKKKREWFAANYRITGTMKNSSTSYGGTLTANAYKLQHYNATTKKWVNVPATEVSFTGWATKENGSKQFDNKVAFKPSWFWRLTYDDSITLYAAWE